MGKIVQVQLGEYRDADHYDLTGVAWYRGDYVIREVDRGSEFGLVVTPVSAVCPAKTEHKSQGRILRKATEGDLRQIANNRTKVQDAVDNCVRDRKSVV